MISIVRSPEPVLVVSNGAAYLLSEGFNKKLFYKVVVACILFFLNVIIMPDLALLFFSFLCPELTSIDADN